MDMHGNALTCMEMYENVWKCMEMNGNVWMKRMVMYKQCEIMQRNTEMTMTMTMLTMIMMMLLTITLNPNQKKPIIHIPCESSDSTSKLYFH